MSTGTIDGTSPPGTAEPGTAVQSVPRRPRAPRVAAAAALTLTIALIIAALLGAHYQPVTFGGGFAPPAGPHLISKAVNHAGGMRGQYYLPPQPPAHGSFQISLGNTGPLPVTIESLSLLSPGMPAGAVYFGRPFRIDGTPTYTLEDLRHGQRPFAPRRLAGAVLAPGEYIYVQIPFVTARCWYSHSTWELGSVWVTTRSLLWTHDVPISWTEPLYQDRGAIISEEGYASPGAPRGVVCPA